jgi:hypothetical protein
MDGLVLAVSFWSDVSFVACDPLSVFGLELRKQKWIGAIPFVNQQAIIENVVWGFMT